MKLAIVVLALLPILSPPGLVAAQTNFSSVAEWAEATDHTYFAEFIQTLTPDVFEVFSDPTWVGTVFALSNQALDMAGQFEQLGDFQGVLAGAANDSGYFDGLRAIALYHIHPDEALTLSDLLNDATQGMNLTTALPLHNIGLEAGTTPQGQPELLLVPEDSILTNIIGNPTVVQPDITAGQAIVHVVSQVLLPVLT